MWRLDDHYVTAHCFFPMASRLTLRLLSNPQSVPAGDSFSSSSPSDHPGLSFQHSLKGPLLSLLLLCLPSSSSFMMIAFQRSSSRLLTLSSTPPSSSALAIFQPLDDFFRDKVKTFSFFQLTDAHSLPPSLPTPSEMMAFIDELEAALREFIALLQEGRERGTVTDYEIDWRMEEVKAREVFHYNSILKETYSLLFDLKLLFSHLSSLHPPPRPPKLSVRVDTFDLKTCVIEAIEGVSGLSVEKFGISPPFAFSILPLHSPPSTLHAEGAETKIISVPSYVYYILSEILKNSVHFHSFSHYP